MKQNGSISFPIVLRGKHTRIILIKLLCLAWCLPLAGCICLSSIQKLPRAAIKYGSLAGYQKKLRQNGAMAMTAIPVYRLSAKGYVPIALTKTSSGWNYVDGSNYEAYNIHLFRNFDFRMELTDVWATLFRYYDEKSRRYRYHATMRFDAPGIYKRYETTFEGGNAIVRFDSARGILLIQLRSRDHITYTVFGYVTDWKDRRGRLF